MQTNRNCRVWEVRQVYSYMDEPYNHNFFTLVFHSKSAWYLSISPPSRSVSLWGGLQVSWLWSSICVEQNIRQTERSNTTESNPRRSERLFFQVSKYCMHVLYINYVHATCFVVYVQDTRPYCRGGTSLYKCWTWSGISNHCWFHGEWILK